MKQAVKKGDLKIKGGKGRAKPTPQTSDIAALIKDSCDPKWIKQKGIEQVGEVEAIRIKEK
jgi:hypothetical protein